MSTKRKVDAYTWLLNYFKKNKKATHVDIFVNRTAKDAWTKSEGRWRRIERDGFITWKAKSPEYYPTHSRFSLGEKRSCFLDFFRRRGLRHSVGRMKNYDANEGLSIKSIYKNPKLNARFQREVKI